MQSLLNYTRMSNYFVAPDVILLICLATILTLVVQINAADTKSGVFPRKPVDKPNVIIFNADDMGWGDLSVYGHPTQEWGPVDEMAREGMRFTNMYAAAPICTPSRAGLMTGRLPVRSGVYGKGRVFWPTSKDGLPAEEITIAEALKDEGYSTGMVGKWHLGVNAHSHNDGTHLPHNHGFDYVGLNLPLSNAWECEEEQRHMEKPDPMYCMLYDNATIVQQPYSHFDLSEGFVKGANDFIRSATEKDQPFFLYFALAQTHVDMFNNPGFVGSSVRGLYGDNMREMSWSVGAVMDEVKSLRIDQNTIMYFTSDNGPHIELGNEGGDAGIFKGGKMKFWEGGIRIPGIIRWPGHIQPGSVSNVLTSQMDFFPTIMKIIGGKMPNDRKIDGKDISRVILQSQHAPGPKPISKDQVPAKGSRLKELNRLLVFFCEDLMFAARYGSFKFHFHSQKTWTKEENGAFPERCGDGGFPLHNNFQCGACRPNSKTDVGGITCVTEHNPPLMYNVDKDPNEAYPLDATLGRHKAVMKEMLVKLKIFESGLEIASSKLENRSPVVYPCCTPETFPECECNYNPPE